jgi:aspartate/methionine/tyrosine aminotransferase
MKFTTKLFMTVLNTFLAALAGDQLCISFNGLSKSYRIAGYRSGWMAITGDKSAPKIISKV